MAGLLSDGAGAWAGASAGAVRFGCTVAEGNVTLEEPLLLATSGVGSLVCPETFGAVMGCCIADCWGAGAVSGVKVIG